jgi:hypothetical protein
MTGKKKAAAKVRYKIPKWVWINIPLVFQRRELADQTRFDVNLGSLQAELVWFCTPKVGI